MIYLDNSATTKPMDEAIKIAEYYSQEKFFNPSAVYKGAVDTAIDLIAARKKVASALFCEADEIVFTSGGTESDNTAIFGSVKNKKGRIITSLGEHLAVYNCFNELKNRGFDVQYVKLCADGTIDLEHYKSLLNFDTIFVSIIHISNETGAINNLEIITKLAKAANGNCIVHSDGVQAYLKTETNLKKMGVDLYSVSGHKAHCQKGIGALYIKKGVKINPLLIGASQEFGIRAGTENIPLICSFAEISLILKHSIRERAEFVKSLREKFYGIIEDNITDFIVNGGIDNQLQNILSLSISGIKSEILIQMLSDRGVYIGSGSACSSKQKVSRVLKETGIPQKYLEGSVRISFTHTNTLQETENAANIFIDCVKTLRHLIDRR